MRLKSRYSIAVLALACATTSASASSDATPREPLRFRGTLQELMDARIDPAADALWDSVAFIASLKGEEDRRPRTPAQWAAVRQNALALISGASDLGLAGRRVSALTTTPGPGELPAWKIQALIVADPAGFAKRAQGLRSAAKTALAAIDAKNADALSDAGGVIDAACEACHVVYWYPGQARSER